MVDERNLVDLLEPVSEGVQRIRSLLLGESSDSEIEVEIVPIIPSVLSYDSRGFEVAKKEVLADMLSPDAEIDIKEIPQETVQKIEKSLELGKICYIFYFYDNGKESLDLYFGWNKKNSLNLYTKTETGNFDKYGLEPRFILDVHPSFEETLIDIDADGIEYSAPHPIRAINDVATNPDHYDIPPSGKIKSRTDETLERYDQTIGPFLKKNFNKKFIEGLKGFHPEDFFLITLHHTFYETNAIIRYCRWEYEGPIRGITSDIDKNSEKAAKIKVKDLLNKFNNIETKVRELYTGLADYCKDKPHATAGCNPPE